MHCVICVLTHMHVCSYVYRAMYVCSYSFEGQQVEGSQLIIVTVLLPLAMDHSLCSGVCLTQGFVRGLPLCAFPV